MNWEQVAHQDQALRAEVDNCSASEALAKHRYDHTLGASPRVSFREYARQCGVSEGSVRSYAKAWRLRSSDTHLTMSDALVMASTTRQKAEAIQAVATAKGVSMKTVQLHHGDEVAGVMEEETLDLRLIDFRKHLAAAHRHLKAALQIDLDDDEQVGLALTRWLGEATQRITLRMQNPDVDWDAELAGLGDDL